MKRISLISLFVCYTVLLYFVNYYPKWEKSGSEATISYDVGGYYLYLPSIFIYHDIDQFSFYNTIYEKYHPTPLEFITSKTPDGNLAIKYSIGTSVIYAPFFFIAHAICLIGNYPPDGYSYPYQLMIGFGCLLYAFAGLWLTRKILLNYFDDQTTALTLLLIVAATNYLNYAAVDVAMTHNLLFTVYAFIVWTTIRFYKNPSLGTAFLLGLLCGLAVIIRPSEIISILIPLLWGISSIRQRLHFILKNYKLLGFLIGALLLTSLQLIYWELSTGHLLYYSYDDQGFSWLDPHLKEGLFSFRKGWFIYTPFMLLIVPGFIFLYKQHKNLFTAVFLFTVLNIYVVFSWDIWWYGGSLGQRSMVQSYLLLCFPIGACVHALLRSNLIWKFSMSLFIGFCIWFNFMLTYQAHATSNVFESEYTTKTYFFASFGKMHVGRDIKKYLDTNERFRGPRKNINTIYFNDLEADTSHIDTTGRISGRKSLFVNDKIQFTEPFAIPLPPEESEWLRVYADFYFPVREWDISKMTQFIVRFRNNDEVIKTGFIRVQRLIAEGEHRNIYIDVKIPSHPFSTIELQLWNANGGTTVYMDNIKVESYK